MKIVRRRLADGTVKEYKYDGRKRYKILPQSLGAVVQEYRRSPEFAKLRPNTQLTYLRAMGHMQQLYDCHIADIRRRNIVQLRNEFADTPALADQIRAVFSVLMKYAVEMEYREGNPATGIKSLASGHYERWSDKQIDFALATFPENLRRAIVLALYTGQRMGDCIRMTWADYDGDGISVAQEKTGEKLWIFCHADLKAELDAWKESRRSVTILADRSGKPYRPDSFSTMFSYRVKKHPELTGCVFHGLRKTAAARLAEAGCSTLEIAAITGHRSLAMVELYTRQADQRRRGKAAVVKLENARRRVPVNRD